MSEYEYRGRGLIGRPLNDRLEAAGAAAGDPELTTTVVDLVDGLMRLGALTALDLQEVPSGPYAWLIRVRVATSGRAHAELVNHNGVVLGAGSIPADWLRRMSDFQIVIEPPRDTDE
jgi:hypothetical protein